MARHKEPKIPDAILDQLLGGADPKTAFDPNGLLDDLKKALAERALNAEMDHHLANGEAGNNRNGYGKKTVVTDTARIELEPEVIPFYAFHPDVRRLVYTTNAIEALNSKLRRAVRARGHFPTDEAAMKLLFLVLNRSEKEWTMPAREWSLAKAQFAILFGERFTRAMA